MDLWVDDLAELMDVLQIPRAHIVGTSVGGVLALKFAAKHPNKTISCVADVPIARLDAMRKLMFASWRKIAQLVDVSELLADVVITDNVGARFLGSGSESVCKSILELLSGISVETVVRVCREMENLDITADLGRIRAPTLVMGTEGDVVSPLQTAESGVGGRKVAQMIPGVKLKIWEGIGHADMIEIPEKSVAFVIEFLKSVS